MYGIELNEKGKKKELDFFSLDSIVLVSFKDEYGIDKIKLCLGNKISIIALYHIDIVELVSKMNDAPLKLQESQLELFEKAKEKEKEFYADTKDII